MGPIKQFPFFGLVLLVLLGCRGGKIDPQGRYQGTQTSNGKIIQVVAQVPSFIKIKKENILRFKTYETLASAKGTLYRIAFIDDKSIKLNSDFLPQEGVILKIEGFCASGTLSDFAISACWNEGKIDFEFKDMLSPEKSRALHLVKDDSLPSIKDPVSPDRVYSLDELLGRAKYLNYSVSQEAERVFQAKQNIGVARGNLLPRLNVKSLVGVFTQDYLSIVGSLFPFLIPSNWYKWKQTKQLFQAERFSFASLRGNEMSAVEGLYYLLLRDQMVLNRLKNQIAWMKETQQGLQKEESIGTTYTGAAEYFGASIVLLERDRIGLEALIKNEYGQLSQSVALPPLNGITKLTEVSFPSSLLDVEVLDPYKFYKDAQEKSYEIKTLNHLQEAAKYTEREVLFDFLNPDSNGGLGFGTPYQIRIGKSKQAEVKKKVEETYSLIELKASVIANQYNQALDTYKVANQGLNLTEKRLKWLINRHLQGDGTMDEEEFVDQLAELHFKMVGYLADQDTSVQMWLFAKSTLDRLLLRGFYGTLEDAVPMDPKDLLEYEEKNSLDAIGIH